MRFSTVDSASPRAPSPPQLHTSEPCPAQNNILSFNQAPGSDWENVLDGVGGGGWGCAHWRWLFTRNESGSEPQWEGLQRCRIFLNEITPYTPPPSLLYPHPQRRVPDWSSLPVADVRRALLWLSPRARASILPPISAPETLKKRRCERHQVRVWHNFDEDGSSREQQTRGLSSLFKLVPSSTEGQQHHLISIIWLGSYKRTNLLSSCKGNHGIVLIR